jgi:HlyD family secretion protein
VVPKDSQPLGTTIFQWSCLLVITGTIVAGGFYLYTNGSLKALATRADQEEELDDIVQAKPRAAAPNTIAALGRIEPKGEIVRVSSSSALETPKIEQLMVKEGDTVQSGQIIAVLDGLDRRQAALERAKSGVQIAQAKLQRVRAGNSDGDISAQESAVNAQREAIARFEAELSNAQVELDRNQSLYTEGAISQSVLDAKRLARDVSQRQLTQAKETFAQAQNTLRSVAEVRPEDIQVAQAEVDSAIASVKQAEADLNLTFVRSPMSGQVLKIHAHPGEVIGQEGVLQMAQTSQMYVIAQVYETDIDKVRVGQRATVTSTSFEDQLKGSVEEISRQVIRQNVFENNPFANTDNRVVEVKIRLEGASSARVAGLSNLQVDVVINRNK